MDSKREDWDKLCDYVKKEILEYDDNMAFPKYLVYKLQGLKKGQNIANNNAPQWAKYSDKVLYVAFVMNKTKIVNYLHKNRNTINDEKHKINIIAKIVEPSLNDVYLRLQEVDRKAKEPLTKNLDRYNSNKKTVYHKKTREVNDKMKKLL